MFSKLLVRVCGTPAAWVVVERGRTSECQTASRRRSVRPAEATSSTQGRPANHEKGGPMPRIAAEALVERLIDWGVDTIFGLPGDGINGIMEGLRRNQEKIRFILVHHEEAAAFMATGYAKSTGRLGVCLATSGPGAIHLLNGLYDAKLDHAPVLAITGMQESQMLGTGYQQEVALEKLFMDVAEYDQMIHVPVQVHTLVDLAVRHALAGRCVSH